MEAARQNRALKQKRMRNRSEILKALSCRNRVRRFKFSRFTPARFGRFGADFLKFNNRGLGALKFHRFGPSRRKFRHLRSGRLKLHAPRLGRLKFHLGLGSIKISPFGLSRAKFDAPKLGRAKFDRFRTLGAKILNFIRFEIFSANFAAAGGFKICGVKFCRSSRTEGFGAEARHDFACAGKVGTESSRTFARASGFDTKRPCGAARINGSDARRFYGSVRAGSKILRSHGSANADRSEILRSRIFARASGSEILRSAPFSSWRRARVDLPARRLLARLRFSFGLPVCRQARVYALSRLGRKR